MVLLCISLLLSVLYNAIGDRTHQVYINGYWTDRDELYKEEIKKPNILPPSENITRDSSSSGDSINHGSTISENILDSDPMHREVSFIPAILKHIMDPHDIVYLSRFWYEKKISYGK